MARERHTHTCQSRQCGRKRPTPHGTAWPSSVTGRLVPGEEERTMLAFLLRGGLGERTLLSLRKFTTFGSILTTQANARPIVCSFCVLMHSLLPPFCPTLTTGVLPHSDCCSSFGHMDAPPVLPLALIGAAITLPANIKTREEFYEVIRDKRQVSSSKH